MGCFLELLQNFLEFCFYIKQNLIRGNNVLT